MEIPKELKGVKIPLIQSTKLRVDHFKEFRGHGESLQEILAKKQLKNR
jgi:hypothetical protein